MNVEELARAVVEEMKQNHHTLWLDPEIHSTQHEFIKMLIDERAEKNARRERIKEKVAGSLVLSLILGLIGLVGAGLLDWVRTHIK